MSEKEVEELALWRSHILDNAIRTVLAHRILRYEPEHMRFGGALPEANQLVEDVANELRTMKSPHA